MKKILLTIALLLISTAAFAVYEETAYNDNGYLFIRLINNTNSWASCYYRDDYNYYTFSIAPQTITQWQPVYGYYQWECRTY